MDYGSCYYKCSWDDRVDADEGNYLAIYKLRRYQYGLRNGGGGLELAAIQMDKKRGNK